MTTQSNRSQRISSSTEPISDKEWSTLRSRHPHPGHLIMAGKLVICSLRDSHLLEYSTIVWAQLLLQIQVDFLIRKSGVLTRTKTGSCKRLAIVIGREARMPAHSQELVLSYSSHNLTRWALHLPSLFLILAVIADVRVLTLLDVTQEVPMPL